MNPNKALWEKGDFTRIAPTMRESGEALVKELGITSELERARSRLRRRDDRAARGEARRPTCSGIDIAPNLLEAGERRAESEGLSNITFQEGDATDLQDLDGRHLRPRHQHLRGDVRTQAVRRGQRDGAGDPSRRSDRDGELDPERPDAGRTDPQDQRRILAATAGGIRQSDDLGRREQRDRAFRRSGCAESAVSFERDTYYFNFAGTPADFLPTSASTTARR